VTVAKELEEVSVTKRIDKIAIQIKRNLYFFSRHLHFHLKFNKKELKYLFGKEKIKINQFRYLI
jgi:hypothetical protein